MNTHIFTHFPLHLRGRCLEKKDRSPQEYFRIAYEFFVDIVKNRKGKF